MLDDVNPRSALVAQRDHVTIVWGRDYSDVLPVKGVALGGKQVIDIGVEVTP
jgi:hypothetical protein